MVEIGKNICAVGDKTCSTVESSDIAGVFIKDGNGGVSYVPNEALKAEDQPFLTPEREAILMAAWAKVETRNGTSLLWDDRTVKVTGGTERRCWLKSISDPSSIEDGEQLIKKYNECIEQAKSIADMNEEPLKSKSGK